MLELGALLLGLEPVTALTVGVGALILVPIVGAVNSMTGNALTESARSAAKTGLIFAFDAFDKTKSVAAEAGESFQDLLAEAKAEKSHAKNGATDIPPREVAIVSE